VPKQQWKKYPQLMGGEAGFQEFLCSRFLFTFFVLLPFLARGLWDLCLCKVVSFISDQNRMEAALEEVIPGQLLQPSSATQPLYWLRGQLLEPCGAQPPSRLPAGALPAAVSNQQRAKKVRRKE
jgi:hypothetical protein